MELRICGYAELWICVVVHLLIRGCVEWWICGVVDLWSGIMVDLCMC